LENILDYSYEELRRKFETMGLEPFRATQLFDWIYKKKATNFFVMTNLSKQTRQFLMEHFEIIIPEPIKASHSSDGTVKFLWKYPDGNTVESVILRYPDRTSACISSQVGCPLNCTFCATGMSGYLRNLTSGEIIAQILGMEKAENERIDNVVFMGMGEPMLNYDEVMRAIHVMTDAKALKIGQRHISISTAGIVEGIIKLSDDPLDVILSVSLHAATDEKRSKIMPVNKRYPLSDLIDALTIYQKAKSRRITFEYILFDGFNDSFEDAQQIVELLKDLKCNVNLIKYNETGSGFSSASAERTSAFEKFLKDHGVEAVVRAEKGADIEAACGQLRRKTL